MIFSSRIRTRDLANLCRRLSTSLEAGVDVRRVFAREAGGRTSGALRRQLDGISQRIARGDSLSAAIAETDDYFPAMFREMVAVGEATGHSAEVFRHLAEHYEGQEKLRRAFLASITWPMLQLTAAVSVVGLLIAIMGILPPAADGKPMDLLGFGLIGTSGLVTYLLIVAAIVAVIWGLVQASRRGMFWILPLQSLLMRVPKLGRAIETLALARLAWSLNLTFGAGMDIMLALPLSLRSMHNAYFDHHSANIVQSLRRGQEVHEALAETRVFPPDFLDAVEVGEHSGRLPETMAILSDQYQDESRRAIGVLTVIAGFVIWALVAMLIILLIFRLFGFYVGEINKALK